MQNPGPPDTRSQSSVPQPAPIPTSASISKASTATPKASLPVTTQTAPANPDEFTVIVHAREESWVSITADSKSVESELLPAGSERIVRGRKDIIVKAGNAGGVDLQFNGKKLAAIGDFGEVKTITFGPGGVLPNSPTTPSTP